MFLLSIFFLKYKWTFEYLSDWQVRLWEKGRMFHLFDELNQYKNRGWNYSAHCVLYSVQKVKIINSYSLLHWSIQFCLLLSGINSKWTLKDYKVRKHKLMHQNCVKFQLARKFYQLRIPLDVSVERVNTVKRVSKKTREGSRLPLIAPPSSISME